MSSYNLVTKEGNELLKTKRWDDKEKKLDALKQKWENMCQLSVARQHKLEEAGEKLEQFYTELKVWTSKLPSLDSTERVHGDVDTVRGLLENHTVSTSLAQLSFFCVSPAKKNHLFACY